MDEQDAAALGERLVEARPQNPDGTYWEEAAGRAGIATRLVRVIREEPAHAFLLDEGWVVDLGDNDYSVRAWQGKDDPLFASAQALDAFEDLESDV
jgi:hypothetical protein